VVDSRQEQRSAYNNISIQRSAFSVQQEQCSAYNSSSVQRTTEAAFDSRQVQSAGAVFSVRQELHLAYSGQQEQRSAHNRSSVQLSTVDRCSAHVQQKRSRDRQEQGALCARRQLQP
jgi:hypothetical protein